MLEIIKDVLRDMAWFVSYMALLGVVGTIVFTPIIYVVGFWVTYWFPA